MPTKAEWTALAALPIRARREIQECDGPGFGMWEGGDGSAVLGREAVRVDQFLWLPCDSLEVVRVAAEVVAHCVGYSLANEEGKPLAYASCSKPEVCNGMMGRTEWHHEARGATPHLAALALLAEVWR